MLALSPDLVGLQEWHAWFPSRRRLLRDFPRFAWFTPWLGGCAIGVPRDRFEIRGTQTVWLSRPG